VSAAGVSVFQCFRQSERPGGFGSLLSLFLITEHLALLAKLCLRRGNQPGGAWNGFPRAAWFLETADPSLWISALFMATSDPLMFEDGATAFCIAVEPICPRLWRPGENRSSTRDNGRSTNPNRFLPVRDN
jgi:hypothetical protein